MPTVEGKGRGTPLETSLASDVCPSKGSRCVARRRISPDAVNESTAHQKSSATSLCGLLTTPRRATALCLKCELLVYT
uniref:Uncharacterized protein n=1 Tax=Steinernema glaseri TaxID=37863 RepID=A0A1I8A890_9BILA